MRNFKGQLVIVVVARGSLTMIPHRALILPFDISPRRRQFLKAALHNPVAKTLPRPGLGSHN